MKIVSFEKQVGYPVTFKGNRDRTNQYNRTYEATRTVAVYPKASASRPMRDSLKRMQSPGTNLPPSAGCRASNPEVRSHHWWCASSDPAGANMRSKEIVLAVLVKGHRTDPVQVWVYQTLTTLKMMLRSNGTWIPLWKQAWEAMQKRRVIPGTEGLAANVDRVLRRNLVVMGERARGEDRRRRDITHHPVSFWRHRIRQAAREWRLRQAANRRAAKDLDKLDFQMSTRLLRGKTLTSIQRGQLRAILAGAVHTCARMWARGTVVKGLCPACGHENEDLTPPLVELQRRTVRAHQGENTSAHERGSHAPGIQRCDFGSEGHPTPGLGQKQQNQRDSGSRGR